MAQQLKPYVNTREHPAVKFLGVPNVMRSKGEYTN